MAQSIVVITQARTNSSRFPNKILKQVNNQTLLEIHLERLKKSKHATRIIVATTINKADEIIAEIASKNKTGIYRGSENDVLDRYYQAVSKDQPEWVIRVTSDCPLIDPTLLDEVINYAIQHPEIDYITNTLTESYPDGQDIEVFKFTALEKAWNNATLLSEREHVTLHIRNPQNSFVCRDYPSPDKKYGAIRMTVDEEVDFKLIERLILDLGLDKTWQEYADFMIQNNLTLLNKNITRNEGLQKSITNDTHEK